MSSGLYNPRSGPSHVIVATRRPLVGAVKSNWRQAAFRSQLSQQCTSVDLTEAATVCPARIGVPVIGAGPVPGPNAGATGAGVGVGRPGWDDS